MRYSFTSLRNIRRSVNLAIFHRGLLTNGSNAWIEGCRKDRSTFSNIHPSLPSFPLRQLDTILLSSRCYSEKSNPANDGTANEDQAPNQNEEESKNKTFSDRLDTATKPLIVLLIAVACIAWLASDREEHKPGVAKPDHGEGIEGLKNALIYNIKRNISELLTFDTYESKILPDPLPAPYAKPLTLFIELDELLATLRWDKSIGWRIYTRPGMKQFLTGIGRFYEVVLCVNAPAHLGDPVCQSFDPQFFYSTYRLYRDHMVYKNNCYIKDLAKMNRDLSKAIILDVNPESIQLQEENGIIINKWNGDEDDRALLDLEKILIELYVLHSLQGEHDIRNILKQIKAAKSTSLLDAWSAYKGNLREEYDRRLTGASPVRSFFFGKSLINRDNRRAKNIVDVVENIAREEKEAYANELQSHLDSIIQAQKKQDEMIRQHLEEGKTKGLRLWDYLTGEATPPLPTPSESPNSDKAL